MSMELEGIFLDDTEIKGDVSHTTIPYDYLVYAVGAEVQTFGIPGVQEKACFMKELVDAEVVSGVHAVFFFWRANESQLDAKAIQRL